MFWLNRQGKQGLFLLLCAIKEKGFSFTLEALISLMILTAVLSIPAEKNESNLEKIYCLQKENDLIKVWVKTKNFDEIEMKEDFRKMFPFQKGEIIVNEKKNGINGEKGLNELKTAGFYFENGKLKEISVKVFV